MNTIDLECLKCGKHYQWVQNTMEDVRDVPCPACGAKEKVRVS